jgi:thiamine transporter ThiT
MILEYLFVYTEYCVAIAFWGLVFCFEKRWKMKYLARLIFTRFDTQTNIDLKKLLQHNVSFILYHYIQQQKEIQCTAPISYTMNNIIVVRKCLLIQYLVMDEGLILVLHFWKSA